MRIAGAALAGGLSVAGAVVLAQEGGSGPRLTFGLSQTFDVNDNLDLDVESEGSTAQSFTGLSFGLSSQTELSTLEFFAGTALRITDGPDSGNEVEVDLDGTRIGLAYDRAVATAALSVDGRYTMDQIDTTLTLADFGPGAEVPEDFSQLQGTGMRRFFAADAVLSLGLDDPVGYEFSAGASALNYTDTSDPDLFGNTRARLGAAVIAQLNEVTEGRLGLSYGSFSSDNPDNSGNDSTDINLGVTRALQNGTVGFVIFAENYSGDTNNDDRVGLSIFRALDLPAGALNASLGATQVEDQDPELTGRVAWSQALPDGSINLAANQAVRNDSDDNPQYVTGIRFGYVRELDPLSQLGLDVGYALTQDILDDDRTSSASISAIYSRSLTEDWALDIGYTYRQRDENDEGMARSNAIFFGLRRAWEWRP
jgi:hypothetical protein